MIKLSQIPERIAKFIEPEPYSGCWLSTSCEASGYPSMTFGQRLMGLHRVVYEMYIGGIENGCDIHHKCRTPFCVNPNHLEQLSRSDHRRLVLSEQTHCVRGHEFAVIGFWVTNKGNRVCKECSRIRCRMRYAGWRKRNPERTAWSQAQARKRKYVSQDQQQA